MGFTRVPYLAIRVSLQLYRSLQFPERDLLLPFSQVKSLFLTISLIWIADSPNRRSTYRSISAIICGPVDMDTNSTLPEEEVSLQHARLSRVRHCHGPALDLVPSRETYKPARWDLSDPTESRPSFPQSTLSTMLRLAVFSQLAGVALGAIGPSAILHIANQNISPDGFDRS